MIHLHAPKKESFEITISFASRPLKERLTLVLQDPQNPGVFGTYLSLNAKSHYSGVVQDAWILVDTPLGRFGLPLTRWKELLEEGVILEKSKEPFFT